MVAMIDGLLRLLPGPVRRRAMPHTRLLAQLLQFGLVGTAGFVVNTAVLYALRGTVGLYAGDVVAYLVAVTTTWWLNRVWTFRGVGSGRMHHQLARFAVANLPGLALNLGAYFTLVTVSALCAAAPVLAVAAGALAGMSANFLLSRAVVFR